MRGEKPCCSFTQAARSVCAISSAPCVSVTRARTARFAGLLQAVFLDVRDAVGLAVALAEHEAGEGAVLGEGDELFVEAGVLVEMALVGGEACIGDLRAQAVALGRIDGEARGLSADEAGVGDEHAPFLVAVDGVLRREARQDAEGIDAGRRLRSVERAQIGDERVLRRLRRRVLARGEQAAVEELVDGEEHGVAGRDGLLEPGAKPRCVAGRGVVVHERTGRRHDVAPRDAAERGDVGAAGRAAVERHEEHASLRRALRGDGREGGLRVDGEVPEAEREGEQQGEQQQAALSFGQGDQFLSSVFAPLNGEDLVTYLIVYHGSRTQENMIE